MVKRVSVAFNDKEYKKLMAKCGDCQPLETPYSFIKQLVLKEIGEKQVERQQRGLEKRDEANNQRGTEQADSTAENSDPPFI